MQSPRLQEAAMENKEAEARPTSSRKVHGVSGNLTRKLEQLLSVCDLRLYGTGAFYKADLASKDHDILDTRPSLLVYSQSSIRSFGIFVLRLPVVLLSLHAGIHVLILSGRAKNCNRDPMA